MNKISRRLGLSAYKEVRSPGERKSGASGICIDQVICAAEQLDERGHDARRMDLRHAEPGSASVQKHRASPELSERLREGQG